MRFFLLVIFGLISPCFISAQTTTPLYTWQYTNGVIDSGFVKNVNARLKKEDAIRLFHHNEHLSFGPPKIPLDYSPIDLLVFKSDTLLIRTKIEGEDVLLLRLRKGIPEFFKSVDKKPTYYWRTAGQYEPINLSGNQELLINQLGASNVYNRNLSDVKSGRAAVAFAKDVYFLQQHQDEQRIEKHFRNRRNRIGLSWALYQESQTDNFRSSPSSTTVVDYVIQMPSVSLNYQRQLLAHNEALFAQLQLRTFRKKATDNWKYYWISDPFAGIIILNTADVAEELSIFNLYFYPGIKYQFYENNRFSTSLGAGASLVLPVQFKRTVDFTNFSNLDFPNNGGVTFPVKHVIERGQYLGTGYYFNLGIDYQLSSLFTLGIEARWEKLSQDWLGRGSDENFYYSDLFRPREHLARPDQLQIQLQMLYNW